jgi:hypothetical protein
MGCQPPLKFLSLGFGQFWLTRLGGDTIPDRLCKTNPFIDAERDNLSQGTKYLDIYFATWRGRPTGLPQPRNVLEM